jgi:isopentenyl diphosphate isomerase/L-lactate dehydrogenase-like FMN-dependent dehydrogenase
MGKLERAFSVEDVRKIARGRLPRAVFEVIEGGAGDEVTLAANRSDLNDLELLPRSLEDVSNVGLATRVLGVDLPMPVLLAPCSFGRMCDPEGERAIARAAGVFGVGYIMPGGASESPERVAEVATGPLWYQIYMKPEDSSNEDLLARVRDSGFQALVVSVDTPTKAYRERDMRNGLSLPLTINQKTLLIGLSKPGWARRFVVGNMSSGFSLTAARDAYYNFETATSVVRVVTLRDIEWLRERWKGPLIVKGLLSDDKIRDLVNIGVNAVSVSNHGGRNLDGVSSAISALPRIVEAADGDLEVFVDGGIRRGIDVIRALALGASACLIGRPYMYGLAAGGQRGVERVLSLIRDEIRIALTFTGCRSPGDVDSSVLTDRTLSRMRTPRSKTAYVARRD